MAYQMMQIPLLKQIYCCFMRAKKQPNIPIKRTPHPPSTARQSPDISPIYEMEEIYTQEIMLPFHSNEHIQFLQRNNSDFLREPEKPLIKPSPSQLAPAPTERKETARHPNFTRESLQEMNRRQRNIRTSHYKRPATSACPPIAPEDSLQNNPFLTARQLRLSNDKMFTRKNIMSSYAQRAVNSIMRADQSTPTPSRATTQERRRSDSGAPSRSRHNPLVIYPFESKLKLRRVDDNPKVLGSIIRKKFKQMEKEQLYLYIDGIVHRR